MIASGASGVTPAYLRSGRQLEIKGGHRGAKPGEGGHFPPEGGRLTCWAAQQQAGVALISQPRTTTSNSIEDLAPS